MQKYVMRKDVTPMEPLYQFYDDPFPSSGGAGAEEKAPFDTNKGHMGKDEVFGRSSMAQGPGNA